MHFVLGVPLKWDYCKVASPFYSKTCSMISMGLCYTFNYQTQLSVTSTFRKCDLQHT